ncbi:MAG: hypothetical protein R3277_06140 [Brumimicrobium sp.]|nr:hypothetical protein [Brumimicrobium sp.]
MKFLVQTFIDLFNNYKDYAPSNIRAKGLVNILMDRAIRFFGMTEVVEESTDKHPKFKNQKASRSVKSISHKYFIRFVFRIIIFPVYLGFLMVYRIFKKKRTKGLQNCYKT